MVKHPCLTLFCSFISTSSYAIDAIQSGSIYDMSLEQLMDLQVVTAASGFEQSLKRAAANATIITQEEWQAKGAYTLAEAINSVAGIHVTEAKINFKHSIFAIRGLSGSFGEQVKILVDGQSMESMQDGGVYLGFRIPLDMFKRIEIIKGPGSVIYGADAFAGIINLVSYEHQKAPSTLTIRKGSFDSESWSWMDNFNIGEHQFNLAVNYLSSDDDNGRVISGDLQSTFDQIFASNASKAPGPIDEHYEVFSVIGQWQWQRWSLNYHTWRNFDVGLGAGISQSLDTQGHANSAHSRLTLNWDISDWVPVGKLNASLSYKRSKEVTFLHVFPAGATLPIGSTGNIDFANPVGVTIFSDGIIGTPTNRGTVRHAQIDHLIDFKSHKIRWELGYEGHQFRANERKNFGPGVIDGTQAIVNGTLTDVSGSQYIYVPNISRHFYYLSLLDEWQIDPQWLLTMGARYDKYSDFGSTTNPRFSLRYQMKPSLALKMFAGSAFRAPSIADLYAQNNPVTVGNPQLKPEGVNTYEVGFSGEYLVHDNLHLTLSTFKYEAFDLINYLWDNQAQGSIAQNAGEQKGRGGEISLRWKPQQNMTVNANYSRLNGSVGEHPTIADIPKTMFNVDMNWRIDSNWQWFIDAKWVKDRERGFNDNRPAPKDYLSVNSRLAYNHLIPDLTVAVKVSNLFDKKAYEPSNGSIGEDYPQPGRQLVLEMNYQW